MSGNCQGGFFADCPDDPSQCVRGCWSGKPHKMIAWVYPSGATTYEPFDEYTLRNGDDWSGIFTRKEAAKFFNVTPQSLDRWVRTKSGPVEFRRVGRGMLQFRLRT